MAFLIDHIKDGHIPPWEYLPTAAATYLIGDACVLVSGNAARVSAGVGQDTDEGPHYVCMANQTITVAGTLLPYVKAQPGIVLRTTLSVADPDLAVGIAYGIYTDGRQFDHTPAKGCFTVEKFDGLLAGNYVYGQLV